MEAVADLGNTVVDVADAAGAGCVQGADHVLRMIDEARAGQIGWCTKLIRQLILVDPPSLEHNWGDSRQPVRDMTESRPRRRDDVVCEAEQPHVGDGFLVVLQQSRLLLPLGARADYHDTVVSLVLIHQEGFAQVVMILGAKRGHQHRDALRWGGVRIRIRVRIWVVRWGVVVYEVWEKLGCNAALEDVMADDGLVWVCPSADLDSELGIRSGEVCVIVAGDPIPHFVRGAEQVPPCVEEECPVWEKCIEKLPKLRHEVQARSTELVAVEEQPGDASEEFLLRGAEKSASLVRAVVREADVQVLRGGEHLAAVSLKYGAVPPS